MKKVSLLLVATICTFVALAGDPIRELIGNSGDNAAFPDADILVIFDSTRTDVQETGLTFVTSHLLYKVLTPAGARELNVLTYGYDPLSAFVELRKAVIYRKNGQTEDLSLNRVLDYPAPARAIYWGAREIMIELGRLEPGDAVEVVMFRKGFTYALLQQDDDSRYIPPMKGHFYDIVDFFSDWPVNLKVYQVLVPREKVLQFEFYNGEAQVSCWLEGDNIRYTFSKRDIRPIPKEPRMVAMSDVAPKLLLSTSPDWYAKSTWFFGVNEEYGSFDVTPEIKDKVDEILVEARTEQDSISLLTHWCADEIRYSGISMGEGEGFTLHKGEMTFQDRCGVCKDKAGMLITMLRAAGFESYPAMTMAGSRIDYIPADQFNHCVTVVKRRDGKYHLLDPTWVPFLRELWSSAEQQQQYLMGVPEGADLATTPVSPPENHFLRIVAESVLSDDGTLRGTLVITAEGQSDGSVRGLFKNSNQTEWNRNIERELLRIHPKATIHHLAYGDPMDYLAGPVRIEIGYEIPGFAMVSGTTLFFKPLTASQLFRSAQPHLYFETGLAERKFPFRDRCSRLVEVSEKIRIPSLGQAIKIPETVDMQEDVASIKGGYSLLDDTLSFEEKVSFSKRIYEAGEWPAFRDVVKAQNRFSDEMVVVELQSH